MARRARKISPTNIYHVMLRGINHQEIFEETEDYYRFLSILKDVKKISEFHLYAYCLMGNHVHLLIEPAKEPLQIVFKRIGCRYVHWYNEKYQRVGHLFQDRYRSETINSEEQLLKIFQYIMNNPVKAGLCDRAGNYQWCSYLAYSGRNDGVTDTKMIWDIFGNSEEIVNYMDEQVDEKENEIDRKRHWNDIEAKELVEKISNCSSVPEFQKLEKRRQYVYMREFKSQGLSLRQISRICGVSKSKAGKA